MPSSTRFLLSFQTFPLRLHVFTCQEVHSLRLASKPTLDASVKRGMLLKRSRFQSCVTFNYIRKLLLYVNYFYFKPPLFLGISYNVGSFILNKSRLCCGKFNFVVYFNLVFQVPPRLFRPHSASRFFPPLKR